MDALENQRLLGKQITEQVVSKGAGLNNMDKE